MMAVLSSASIFAQDGGLDSTFHGDGKGIYPLGMGTASMILQPDGKIVVAGGGYPPDFLMARVNSNGFLDNTFGQGGKVGLPFSYSEGMSGSDRYYVYDGLAVQSDGKILVAGTIAISNLDRNNDFAVARFNTDGTTDNSFGNSGMVSIDVAGNNTNDEAYAVEVQADGKILLAGYASNEAFAVVRFNTDGTIDNTFGSGGIASTVINATRWSVAMTIQPDGKILVAGTVGYPADSADFAIVRYNIDGTLDNTFGSGGKMVDDLTGTDDIAYSLALQADGKILVAGHAPGTFNYGYVLGEFALVRYNPDGIRDNSWLSQTTVVNDGARGISVAIQQDGKAIVAGASITSSSGEEENFGLVRYNTDGTLDNTFGFGGIITTDFDGYEQGYDIAIQPDGKIVVSGEEDENDAIAIARYLSGLNVGLIDFADQDKSVLIYPNPVQGEQMLEYTLEKDELLSIELYDAGGRLVKTFLANQPRAKGSQKELLRFDESLPPGNYVLALTSGSRSVSIRVVKR